MILSTRSVLCMKPVRRQHRVGVKGASEMLRDQMCRREQQRRESSQMRLIDFMESRNFALFIGLRLSCARLPQNNSISEHAHF